MMFILNFDYVLDEESDNSTEKISPASPTKSDQSECRAAAAARVTVAGGWVRLNQWSGKEMGKANVRLQLSLISLCCHGNFTLV